MQLLQIYLTFSLFTNSNTKCTGSESFGHFYSVHNTRPGYYFAISQEVKWEMKPICPTGTSSYYIKSSTSYNDYKNIKGNSSGLFYKCNTKVQGADAESITLQIVVVWLIMLSASSPCIF